MKKADKPEELETILTAWRTPAVIGLCEAIRQEEDYTLTPILADALQEAGCSPTSITLYQLRAKFLPEIERQRLVAIIYSDKTAKAVKRIEEMAQKLGRETEWDDDSPEEQAEDEMNYAKLMAAANKWLIATVEDKNGYNWSGYTIQSGGMSWENRFEIVATEFWQCYEIVTGKEVPEKYKRSFFSCSC